MTISISISKYFWLFVGVFGSNSKFLFAIFDEIWKDSLDLQILGKAEFLSPGGSIKDRVAVRIIEEVGDIFLWY